MKLIVGLGNPGPKYKNTRHNIGFIIVEKIAEVFDDKIDFRKEEKSETQKIRVGSEQLLLCKPQTFMNKSGEAVQELAHKYKIPLSDILVIHDEVDLPFGDIRFQEKRGAGGHNGIKSVHQMLGSEDYGRLRFGVGKPPVFVDDTGTKTRATMDMADYVLRDFTREEWGQFAEIFETVMDAIELWTAQGLQATATKYNRPRSDGKELNQEK